MWMKSTTIKQRNTSDEFIFHSVLLLPNSMIKLIHNQYTCTCKVPNNNYSCICVYVFLLLSFIFQSLILTPKIILQLYNYLLQAQSKLVDIHRDEVKVNIHQFSLSLWWIIVKYCIQRFAEVQLQLEIQISFHHCKQRNAVEIRWYYSGYI